MMGPSGWTMSGSWLMMGFIGMDFLSELCGCIAGCGLVKTVVTHPGIDQTHIGWEIGGAGAAVGIVEKQRISHGGKTAAAEGPVGDFIVDFGGCHVVNVLGVVFSTDGGHGADELPGLKNDGTDVAAAADPGKLAVGNGCPIHDHRGNRRHPVVAFASGLTLDQACQKFAGIVRHENSPQRRRYFRQNSYGL